MDKTLNNQTPLHPEADVAAEGMWKFTTQESCHERWEKLPEDQKESWRRRANRAVKRWLASHYSSR
jgi:hypothetical protein